MGFLRRQVVIAALTANAIRPLPGFRVSFSVFFAGWLTGELAPQVLAFTAADAITHATGRRRDPLGLALAGASAAGLLFLVDQARRVGTEVEDALAEGIGLDYVEQLDHAPTPAELAVPWRKLVYPFRLRNDQVRVERNIAYNDHGKRGLLDIYLPVGRPPEGAPVLLQVHGGGWTIGKKEEQGIPLMQHLAAKGWVCVAINYRLTPRDPFPAQVIDVKQAIAWIREHIGSYGGNPDYIAITGGSAGGHLVSLAALTAGDTSWQPGFEDADASVQCAVPHYGIYDFAGSTGLKSAILMRDRFLGPRVLKKRWECDPEAFEDASPILRITPDAPDFFVLHGAHDSLAHVDQARLFVEKLRRVSKRTVVYAELPGAQHAFDVFPSIRSAHIVRAIDRYLHWHWNTYRREHT
ncbi:alpha/beta hydrolase [Nocardioides psychrotolerans]|uniref:Acetyl esterase/lipase n=1 Tax=Nocardioides psychrotolerans TaxID=1005945 RepID=A0A1I3FXB9_9ACTN|nr:alpha/beta hydrolase [Nocardioides psychrotolerans]GEP37360.1 alpha/beta hydrolase [Nocardioides psychrotolerans]SFI15873.1 Acetyl esterase/lipase [Nocardioides psychrotolerans]